MDFFTSQTGLGIIVMIVALIVSYRAIQRARYGGVALLGP